MGQPHKVCAWHAQILSLPCSGIVHHNGTSTHYIASGLPDVAPMCNSAPPQTDTRTIDRNDTTPDALRTSECNASALVEMPRGTAHGQYLTTFFHYARNNGLARLILRVPRLPSRPEFDTIMWR